MRVDDDFMKKVGLAEMPEAEKEAFMEHAEEELEVRVGREMSKNLSEEQLREFDQIQSQNEARAWLEKNAPDFRETVKRVYVAFQEEIMANREQILGS